MKHAFPRSLDAVVVGAGMAGSVAARRLAESGFRVLLIDRGSAADVGRKVCGNGIADDGLESIGRYTEGPSGAEIARRLTRGTIILKDGTTTIEIPKGGIVLNRLLFGQRLLADAIEAGVIFRDRCSCVGWSDRTDNSVRLRDGGGESDVTARMIIDASGYRAVLTRTGGPSHPDAITREEVAVGYREIVPLTEPLERPDDATIAIAPEGARGGYGWIFPMGDRLANVGIGAPLAAARTPIRDTYRLFVNSQERLYATDPVEAGGGLLPFRRPLATFVGDGFMSVGDAACHANPLHGGGITPAIIAAGMASDVAAGALADGDVSAATLWPYNVAFMREVGARHAGQDFVRRFLDSLSEADFLFLTREFARADLMMKTFGKGGTRPRLRAAFRILSRAAKRPRLASMLIRAGQLFDKIQGTYLDYPDSASRFESWLGEVEFQRRTLARVITGGES